MAPPKSSPALPKLTIEEEEIVSNPIICTVPDSPRRIICGPPTSPPEHIVDNTPEQVIEHVIDPEQVNEHVIDQVPDYVTQHVIDEKDEDESDSTVFEDDEDEEECDSAVFEDNEDEEECDSFVTDSIIGPKQQDQDDEDAAGQPTEADGSFDYSRRQSGPPFKQPPPVSNLMAPNALSVFGPTSTVEPPHQIRQRMMTRDFKHGLDHHVNWERRASMKTVRAFAERTSRLNRHNQTTEGGPGDVDDDGDYLEEPSSDDLDKDEVWHQFDPLDYNARGW